MIATLDSNSDRSGAFVDLVDFKWLMAGMGWWVSLTRLQCDGAYVDECLHNALATRSDLLQKHGAQLLGLDRAGVACSHASKTSSTDPVQRDLAVVSSEGR